MYPKVYNQDVSACFRKLGVVLLLLGFLGCSTESPDPASPPAPPAELPSALKFPESIAIDVGKISDSQSTQGSLTLVGMGPLSTAISQGSKMVKLVNQMIDETLKVLNRLEIPVNSLTTTFTRSFSDSNHSFEVKIDFSDYDYDGDGDREGCSGHTGATPVCCRIWVNQERLMACVFDAFPSESNAGAGRFKMVPPTQLVEEVGQEVEVGVVYDHQDPLDKSSDIFGQGRFAGSILEANNFLGHVSLSQVGAEATAKKTVRAVLNQRFDSGDRCFQSYVGQWIENQDYWGGSVLSDGGTSSCGDDFDFTNSCGQISTGLAVTQSLCLDFGIDVEGISSVGLPVSADTALPDDFPASPPF